MKTLHPQFIKDEDGKKLSVILTIEEFNSVLENLEELEDIRLYDESKASEEPSVPMDDAFNTIDAKRKK